VVHVSRDDITLDPINAVQCLVLARSIPGGTILLMVDDSGAVYMASYPGELPTAVLRR